MSEHDYKQVLAHIKALHTYLLQIRESLNHESRTLNMALAERGDEVIGIIREVQTILRKEKEGYKRGK